jgi:glycerophosphoryl diester phosphodiesterase
MSLTRILAHRGADAYRPENTLEAYSLAIQQGADGIELDVHLSKDGQVVIAHDERLERVCDGTGFIKDHTLEELKKFNFNKPFPDQPRCAMPTLAEVYELVKDTPLMVNVEIKTDVMRYPGLPQKILDIERDFDMGGRIHYSSFNHRSLMELRSIDAGTDIGLLYELVIIDPWFYARYVHANAINPAYRAILAYPETVDRCHENGIKVNVWTVDDPGHIDLMLEYGVDSIITNCPDVALARRTKK